MKVDFDVIIAGAGLSGIDAAYRLKTECPDRSFAILEARDAIGGTWDLFRYPGVRSDSDMFTLGYPFSPWRAAKAIADGPSILSYVRETARAFELEEHIRLRHRVVAARWSSAEARWTVVVEVGPQRERKRLTCRFLHLCCGYYDYSAAHAPQFPGVERFKGRIVHPQWWPQDLDWSGKRVVVIGSGATAVTLVPSLAERAAHVTMLQRSPTYVVSRPDRDVVADLLRFVLPEDLAHHLVRWKDLLLTLAFYLFCRKWPKTAGRILRERVAEQLPEGYPVEKHFTPRYDPWDQRVCLVPNGDLFQVISDGRAEVVTDTLTTFDETGLALASGQHLDADIIVTATGLKILPAGGVRIAIDGRLVRVDDGVVYKGMMLSGVPNLAWCFGYTNASWTLRADLISRYLCRLLNFMEAAGWDVATPRAEAAGPERRPLTNFTSGYVQRARGRMPMQGVKAPWKIRQNYVIDAIEMLFGPIDDGAMGFARRTPQLAAGHRRLERQAGAPALQVESLGP
jgi:cation diffusion facilitator CzcD-associated flavoprotein CzcO